MLAYVADAPADALGLVVDLVIGQVWGVHSTNAERCPILCQRGDSAPFVILVAVRVPADRRVSRSVNQSNGV
ncbi:hypothetical protein GCM10010216_49170 [Streptomyces flaveolus]|nr:hypothetical protein GCM10010216_49170 [Streptomyces flaveolus]